MAKAACWTMTDVEARKRGEQTGLDKALSSRKIMTVLEEEAPANYVPAAAVIRRGQALSGFTGCKGSVDGMARLM